MDKRLIIALIAVVIVALGAYALSGGFGGQPQVATLQGKVSDKEIPKDITLKILTRHDSLITMNAKSAFLNSDIAKKYRIVDIRWIGISGNLWVDTIKMSKDIDVAWGGGPVLFDTLANQGLLTPLKGTDISLVLSQIPNDISGAPVKRIINNEVVWCGSAISSFGFTINKQKIVELGWPEPKKWIDLANETYANLLPSAYVGTADALVSTSNTRMFQIILQTYGWEKGWELLVQMGANAKIYDQSGKVQDAAIVGEIAVGTTIDFYGYTAQLQAPQICKYILPSDGTIVNADPIALVNTSPNYEAALAFIQWQLSAEGQTVWLNENINRLPANPKVFDTPQGMARSDLKETFEVTKNTIVIPFSDDLALSYENSLIYYYHNVIVVPQVKLRNAWMQLCDAYSMNKITRVQFMNLTMKLGNPNSLEFTDPTSGTKQTFAESYAKSINSKLASDATFKEKLGSELSRAASTRYDSVITELRSITG